MNDGVLKNALAFSHAILASVVQTGDVVIDATMGNGNDTVALAKLVGETGQVWAFDVQERAVQATHEQLSRLDLLDRVHLLLVGHEHMANHVPIGVVSAVVFNLGYLPRGDKNLTTLPESTLQAVQQALQLLKIGGVLVLMVYRGHKMGQLEALSLLDFVKMLPQSHFRVLRYDFLNQRNAPPFLLAVEKIRV